MDLSTLVDKIILALNEIDEYPKDMPDPRPYWLIFEKLQSDLHLDDFDDLALRQKALCPYCIDRDKASAMRTIFTELEPFSSHCKNEFDSVVEDLEIFEKRMKFSEECLKPVLDHYGMNIE